MESWDDLDGWVSSALLNMSVYVTLNKLKTSTLTLNLTYKQIEDFI